MELLSFYILLLLFVVCWGLSLNVLQHLLRLQEGAHANLPILGVAHL